jgi:hypothetical protein
MGANTARIAAVPEVGERRETSPLADPGLAAIALNIVNRRDELLLDEEGETFPVVVASARAYHAFAVAANGKTPQILKHRSADYASAIRTARKALALEDLVGMAMSKDIDSKRALLAALSPILDELDGDSAGAGMDLGAAVADFAKENFDVVEAALLGRTTTQIYRELVEADEKSRALKNALRARMSATVALARVLGPKAGA